jgi:hypothetical protein
MSKDYFQPIINPSNPGGAKLDAILPARLILNYFKYYPVRYENLRAAKHVLEYPRRIFTGVRQFNEGGWCFTGRPHVWYVQEHVQTPFPDNLVFAVYLNSRFVVYECRAERAANDDPNCPEDWQNRYGGLIWKSTS